MVTSTSTTRSAALKRDYHLPILSAKKSKPPGFTTHPRLVLKLLFIEDEEEDYQELKPYNSVDFDVEYNFGNFLHVGACSLIDGHSNQYACDLSIVKDERVPRDYQHIKDS